MLGGTAQRAHVLGGSVCTGIPHFSCGTIVSLSYGMDLGFQLVAAVHSPTFLELELDLAVCQFTLGWNQGTCAFT